MRKVRILIITGILTLSVSNISSKNPTHYVQPKLFESLDSLKSAVEELKQLENYEKQAKTDSTGQFNSINY